MPISAGEIKKLREKTNAGVMDCKKALEEANGSLSRAEEILKEKGVLRLKKMVDREVSQGKVASYIHGEGKIGVLLEVSSETDFVARTKEFEKLVHEIAMQIAAQNPSDIEDLLSQPFIKDLQINIDDRITEVAAQLGENIKIKRFTRYELGEEI